jgi:hypothetical protein
MNEHSSVDTAPTFVLLGLAWYFISQKILVKYQSNVSTILRWERIKRPIMLTYNTAMTFYSGWTFHEMFKLLFIENDASDLLGTDDCSYVWTTIPHFSRLAVYFYYSKYIEFMDTYFLILSNRRVPWLQYIHHAGAVASMWWLCRTQTEGVWIFVLFNSFIHTLMYFYYAMTAAQLKVPKWSKVSLTVLQMLQLSLGSLLCLYMYAWDTSMICMHDLSKNTFLESRFACMIFTVTNVVFQFGLFSNFFILKYCLVTLKSD